jgi:hypothetical protein
MADLVREINLASAKSTSTIEALLNFLFTSRNADWGVRPVAVVTSMLVVCFLTVLGSRWISGTGDSSGQLYLISLDEKLTRGLDGELTFPAGLPSAFSIALPSFQNQSGALTIVRRADSQEVYRLKPLVLDSKGTAVVSLGPKVLVPGAYIARVTVVDRHNREVIYEYLLSCVEK